MNGPDFEKMTTDEVIAWFKTTTDLSPMIERLTPATEPASRPMPETPMMLASIRQQVMLVDQLDGLADVQGVRRSDVIRYALAAYIIDKTSPVGRDEAEHALVVLRRIVASRVDLHGEAA